LKRNGKHVFYRCASCNYLHIHRVIICCKCQKEDIRKETFDELPLDQFDMFSDKDRLELGVGVCSVCKIPSDSRVCYYEIKDSHSSNGNIYCPEHYIKVKWVMIAYRMTLHNAEESITLGERRRI